MDRPPKSFGQDIVHQLAWHGVLALGVAVILLAIFRGFDFRIVIGYGVPVMIAVAATNVKYADAVRLSGWTFLVGIGIGAGIAHVPQLFPNLGGVAPQLPQWQDRLLTWYASQCAAWGAVVLPFHLFGGGLRYKWLAGRPPQFFTTACYAGLVIASLVCVFCFPEWLARFGFLPVF